jgi:mono/diheme cytochrome c family protein
MARFLRWAGYALASIFGLIVMAAIGVWLISSAKLNASAEARPEHLALATMSQVRDIERQARTLGCFSCHGEGLRGDKMFDEPRVGTIWAPNLTLVATHASDEQLARAIRQGIGVDGRSLFVMPSEAFQHLPDQEVAALIEMIRKLPQGGTMTPRNSYGPLGRVGLVLGQFKTAPQLVAEYAVQGPIPVGSHEAGRQLVITRCSACHAADLSGKEVKPGETSPDLTIAGAYDLPAFKKLLRSGVAAGGQKLPMMGSTARSDLSHMTDPEIEAIYEYLQARAQRISR